MMYRRSIENNLRFAELDEARKLFCGNILIERNDYAARGYRCDICRGIIRMGFAGDNAGRLRKTESGKSRRNVIYVIEHVAICHDSLCFCNFILIDISFLVAVSFGLFYNAVVQRIHAVYSMCRLRFFH